MVSRLINKLLLAGVGLVASWIWFSWSGSDPSAVAVASIPPVVFEGGGGSLQIQFEVNQPAPLMAQFSQYDEATDDERLVEAFEDFEPGVHVRTVDVSPETFLSFDLDVPDASVGAEASWTVTLDGREVRRESDRLAKPLPPNYAFFLQLQADSVEEMRSWRP